MNLVETAGPLLLGELTPREREVSVAVARGLRNRAIAIEFGISEDTVKRHLATIFDKLAIASRVELAIRVVTSKAQEAA